MKTLRSLLSLGRGNSRFDRYYSAVLRSGAGYPTADEARRDLLRYDRATQHISMMR